jgi:hypothetical protein
MGIQHSSLGSNSRDMLLSVNWIIDVMFGNFQLLMWLEHGVCTLSSQSNQSNLSLVWSPRFYVVWLLHFALDALLSFTQGRAKENQHFDANPKRSKRARPPCVIAKFGAPFMMSALHQPKRFLRATT